MDTSFDHHHLHHHHRSGLPYSDLDIQLDPGSRNMEKTKKKVKDTDRQTDRQTNI